MLPGVERRLGRRQMQEFRPPRSPSSHFLGALPNLVVPVAYARCLRLFFERIHHRRQFSFLEPVVAIEKRDNIPAQFRESCIEGRRLPAVLLAQQSHPRRKFADDFRRSIRRTVIHHHNLVIRGRKILLDRAHHRLLDIALVVVRIDQYGQDRLGHRTSIGAPVAGTSRDSALKSFSPASAANSRAKSSPGSRETNSRTSFAAMRPISFSRPRLSQERFIASSNKSTVGALAMKPLIPSRTNSRFPPTSVTMHGRPHSIASTTTSGIPSNRDGSTSA